MTDPHPDLLPDLLRDSLRDQPRLRDVQCITPAGLHRMAYAEWGDADNPRVLVCVHGLTRSGRDFDDLARALAPHYRVICPDVAGRGRSDWLRDPMLYQVPVYVSDMVTLLARLDVAAVDWLGTSMGGMIGMALAALPNTPIRRLVLNDIGPVLSGPALVRISQYVGELLRFPSVEAAVAYIRTVSAPFGPHSDAQWQRLTETVIRRDGEAWTLHYDPSIAVPFKVMPVNASGDVEFWNLYDTIRCPTLAIRGALSDLLTAETHALMGQRGPHARLAEIAGVGHAPTFMHTDQIELVRRFLLEGVH